MLPTQNSLNQPIRYNTRRSISPSIRDRAEDVNSVVEDHSDDDDDKKYYFDIRDQIDTNDTNMHNNTRSTEGPVYKYRALESLTKNMGEIRDVDYFVVCPYRVNTEGGAPFLQFGLVNDGVSLSFIKLPWTESSIDMDKLSHLQGHLVQNRTLYVFFDYHPDNARIFSFIFPVETFVLADEIMNHRMVYRTAISIDVLDFFTRNEQFLYLEHPRGKVYENPVAAYRGTYVENINFMSIFGVPCSQSDAIMGPYYYFTDHINAMKQGIVPTSDQLANRHFKKYLTADNKYRNGSVLRFALFLGITKVILNRPSDTIDESRMKQQLLENADTSSMARSTMRMSDHDGNWTSQYDSVYVGKIDLDDGCKYMNAPLWIVKEYSQQVFLSAHSIDRQISLFL
jgi:hypothetical protein